MKKLFLVFNHTLTEDQKKDALENLGVFEIVTLPEELKSIWSSISPDGELNLEQLDRITGWLEKNSKKNDYVLVQGEFGAVFYVVDFAFYKGLIPVYATTEREYTQTVNEDGSVERKHIFRHVTFRKYIRYEPKGQISQRTNMKIKHIGR